MRAGPNPHSGAVPVAGTFRDVTGKPFNADRGATRLLNRLMRERGFLKVVLPIALLNATQETVNGDFRGARARYRDTADAHPAAVKYHGSYYVTDGHHRIMDAADAGEVATPVRLYDLDGDTQTEFPLLERALRHREGTV